MPELIEDPVTLSQLPPIDEALPGLRIVAVDTGDEDGTVTIAQVLDLIDGTHIPDGSVTTAKLADDAVTSQKIAPAEIDLTKFTASALTDLKWIAKAIGEFYLADDNVVGVDIPPTTSSLYRYVELTSGLTGSGQYNEGCLGSESVSGSSPLVSATAVVALSGSPMNGQTIRLLNTERRMLRAGSAGALQTDAIQNVTGTITGGQESLVGTGPFTAGAPSTANRPNNGTNNTQGLNFDLSLVARTDTETRVKNIGVRIFRRIK